MMKTVTLQPQKSAAILLLAALLASFGLLAGSGVQAASAPKVVTAPGAALPAPMVCAGTCDLYAREGTLTMANTATIPIWGFATAPGGAPSLPGPLIVANAGDTIDFVLHNELTGQNVSLAFPGLVEIPDLVGAVPGATETYTVTLDRPGTFLYEAGLTPNGARQVAMGLYGPIIVRPVASAGQLYEDAVTAFDDEFLAVLSEIDPNFNANPLTFPMETFQPQYWLINGKSFPQTDVYSAPAGNMVAVHAINAGLLHHSMGFLGLGQTVYGQNGVPLTAPYRMVSEIIPPGSTMDTLVEVPATAIHGTRYMYYETSLLLHNSNQRLAPFLSINLYLPVILQQGIQNPLPPPNNPGPPLAYGGMMTYLTATSAGQPQDTGPRVVSASVSPNPAQANVPVTLSATLDDSGTSNPETIIAAEYFIDGLVGPPVAVTPVVGPTGITTVTALIDTTLLAGGEHIFYIRGRDASGDWGPVGAAILNLDKLGPLASGIVMSSNPTNGASDVSIRATCDDLGLGSATIASAVYTLPGQLPVPMATNLITGSVVEASAVIPAASLVLLPEGNITVTVTCTDTMGNTGAPGIASLMIDRSGPVVSAVALNPTLLDLTQPVNILSVRLTGTLTDLPPGGGSPSPLVNAEGYLVLPGPNGTGFDVFAADGAFDEVSEDIYFDIPVVNYLFKRQGWWYVYIHGLDAAGNWGTPLFAKIFVDRGLSILNLPVIWK